MRAWIRRGVLAALAVVGVALLALVLWVASGLPVSLNALRPSLAAAASEALGRTVEIGGGVHLVPALWPTLGVETIQVANPPGFEAESLAQVAGARGQISLPALLRGELQIGELHIEGARIAFETTPDGRNNWTFEAAPTPEPPGSTPTEELLAIRSIALQDVAVAYREGSSGRDYHLTIDALTGSLAPDELKAVFAGRVNGQPYELTLRKDRLVELSRLYESWDLDVEGRVAGVVLAGAVRIDARSHETGMDLSVEAQAGEIGPLVEMLTGREDVRGRFGRLALHATTSGADLHQWADATELDLELGEAALSYGNEPGARPVGFTLAQATLRVARGGPVVVTAEGSLRDQPARGTFEGAKVINLLDGPPWPVALEARGAGATVRMVGRLGDPARRDVPHRVRLEIDGSRLGDLAPWLGVPEQAPAAYRLHGDLEVGSEGFALSSASFALGRTRATGSLAWLGAGPGGRPVARVEATVLDVEELEQNLVEAEEEDDDEPGLTIDCPILPERIAVPDADLEVRIERMVLDPSDARGVAFSWQMREGRVEAAPFRARYGGVDLGGELDVDLTGSAPALALRAGTGAVDLGELGRALGLVANLDARASRVSVDLLVRGHTGRELLSSATFDAVAEDGAWEIVTDTVRETLPFRRVSFEGRPGAPIVAEFAGELRSAPLAISAEVPALVELALPGSVFPARIRAESGRTRLVLDMQLDLPIRYAQGDVAFHLQGERLSDLGPLLGASLPPFGPYEARGNASRRDGRYQTALDLRVRESELSGTVDLDSAGPRPRVVARLEARTVQLADFRRETSPSAAPPSNTESLRRVEPFLSRRVLRAFDAEASIRVGELLSGADSLGGGDLHATLRDGRLVIDPLEVDFPGGEVHLEISIEPGEDDVAASLRAHVDHFDYGILARRFDPRSKDRGTLSLEADIESRGPDLATLVPGANGWLAVDVRPESLEAGVLELWGVNVMRATLRLLNPFVRPSVNCAVALAEIDDGLLESRLILLDTTSMQVRGSGHTDLRTGDLRFEFRPRPKQSGVLTLALPVVVEGTLRDFEARIRPEGPLRMLLRWTRDAIRMPLERRFRRELPADDSAACSNALDGARVRYAATAAP